jgi:HEAT repeat protein
MSEASSNKKLLENSFLSSLMVPIAIVLVGAFIVFGVTKILSSERSYHDLVREMHSKTFGNRWIAAYELSKLINRSQIPEKDIPWLIENLSDIYKNAKDPRTRDFIVVAVGAMHSPLSLPLFETALKDVDKNVRFHTIVALGNLSPPISFEWDEIIKLLKGEDPGLIQSAILCLATHRVKKAELEIAQLLAANNLNVRYSAALGLINFKNESALAVLREIMALEYETQSESKFKIEQINGLKSNLLGALVQNEWKVLNKEVKALSTQGKVLSLKAKSLEALKTLK